MLITVKSEALQKVFTELSVLFKLSEQYRAILFTVQDKFLYVTANTGNRYEACLVIEKIDAPNSTLEVCVTFKDIVDIIPSDSEVDIEVTQTNVILQTGLTDITLNQSNEILTRREVTEVTKKEINTDKFLALLKTLSNTAFLRKAYKISPPITLGSDYSLVKFPTVWVLSTAGNIGGNFIQEDLDILMKFKPTEYANISETLVMFYNSNATLLMNCTPPSENNFTSLAKDMKRICEMSFSGVGANLRRLLKVAGNGMCTVGVCENGLVVTLHRVGMNSVSFLGTAGKIIYSFQLPLEILSGIAGMLYDNAYIYYGGGMICIATQFTTILTSING